MSQPELKIHVEHIVHLTLICSRTASTPGVHKLVLRELLNPRQWKPPEDRKFTLDAEQINELCETAERILREEPSVLRPSPVRCPSSVSIASMLNGGVAKPRHDCRRPYMARWNSMQHHN